MSHGLTVRWSLQDAAPGTEQALRDYVVQESVARFSGMAGLVHKHWQLSEGTAFAGVYVWSSAPARASFLEAFRAAPSKVSEIVGSGPESVEEWDLVAVVAGADGPLTPSR